MSELDVSRLAPGDAAAALRSYPRRYASLLQPIKDDEDVEALAHRVGPDGRSAIAILSDVTRTLVVLREALRQIDVNPTPVLHPAVADPERRDWETPPPEQLADALTFFADEATAMADDIDRVSAEGWTRTGTVADGAAMRAIDVARESARVGHDGLDDIRRTLDSLRD
jgi:hypothetical protein